MKTFLIITAMTLATFQQGRAETKAKEDASRLRADIKQSIDEILRETMLMPYERFSSPEGQQKLLRLIKLAQAESLMKRVEDICTEVTE